MRFMSRFNAAMSCLTNQTIVEYGPGRMLSLTAEGTEYYERRRRFDSALDIDPKVRGLDKPISGSPRVDEQPPVLIVAPQKANPEQEHRERANRAATLPNLPLSRSTRSG